MKKKKNHRRYNGVPAVLQPKRKIVREMTRPNFLLGKRSPLFISPLDGSDSMIRGSWPPDA